MASVAACCGRLQADNSNNLWGRTVLEIRLNADADLTAAKFKAEITQQTNESLERAKVATSLKNLYATGRFVELAANVEPRGEGVLLVFRARARYFIGVVRVEGAPKEVDPVALASASGLRLGQPLTDEGLAHARQQISSTLANSAYYSSEIEVSVDRHPENQEADVIFSVEAGKAARLSGVSFTGTNIFPPATLLRKARWKTGIQLTAARLEQGISRLHAFCVKRDHLEASVSAERRVYDAAKNTEQLVVRVDAGREIRIRVSGARVSSSTLQSILPAYRQASADPLSLQEGEQALTNYFMQRGHYSVSVKLSQKAGGHSGGASNQGLDVTYEVSPGPPGSFVGYAFRGNHSVPASQLSDAVVLLPSTAFELRRGRFDHDLLNRSVQALTTFYQSRGFADVKVSPSLNENYQGQPNQLFVTFEIQEGSQTHVRSLTITGLDPGTEKHLQPSLLTSQGKPYSPARVQTDRNAILSYLSNHGYAQATVDWRASEPTTQHEVDVAFQVNEGGQHTVAQVVVLGNEFTRDSVIDRELTIAAGQPLNQSALLEDQQRLYGLNLFNQVQVSTQNPGSPETGKTVLVALEEAKRWTLGYGGGLDVQRLPGGPQGQYGVSPRVSLEVDRIGIGGRPQTFSLLGHVSNLEKIGSTSYDIPRVLNHPDLDLRITGLADQSRSVATFNSLTQQASITLQKRYSPHTSLLARYNFRHVSVSDLHVNPASIPLLGSVLVASVGGSYVNDQRDNPVDATRGSYSSVDASLAWTGFGSSANFGRVIGQNSTYYRLGSHVIFARNTRFGVEPPFGPAPTLAPGTTVTGVESLLEDVPLPERLFMGGPDSHRAFALNEAGPRDPISGYPIGGLAEFLNQMELRFPLQRNHFGLVIFEDAGNVFSTIGHLRLLKFTQSSPTDLDYDVQSAGIGVRYQTPVGPLRFDVGYSPNIPQYQVCSNQNVSVCPPNEVEVFRLPKFQFFLSVGQSF
ncbi:MAG TPA: POTRA domain-containing protein [Terriglobia bacterium]|nr:POTRA domain-containing protein [Terriglobia bacterium]